MFININVNVFMFCIWIYICVKFYIMKIKNIFLNVYELVLKSDKDNYNKLKK